MSSRQPTAAAIGLRLHAELDYIEPAIWRRLELPAGLHLDDLHWVMQIVFGWQNSHLHAFVQGRRTLDNERIGLENFFRKPNDRISYQYDFGDSWTHTITLDGLLPKGGQGAVRCLEGARAAPPEDCGGVPGYENLLVALANPKHPEHEDMVEWAGEYDPEAFDIDAVNKTLAKIPVRKPAAGARRTRRP